MKKDIRLLACDLDGTLLAANMDMTPRTVSAVKRLQDCGVIFAAATGRIHRDAVEICTKYGITPYVISNNGGTAHTPEGELVYSCPISKPAAKAMAAFLEARRIPYGIGKAESFFTDWDWGPAFGNGMVHTSEVIEQVDEPGEVYSLSIMFMDEGQIEETQAEVERHGELTCSLSGANHMDIMNKGALKSFALEALCEHLGITAKQAAAIGDSFNDLAMLETAGTAFAMGNGEAALKSVADYVVATNKEDGVAEAIEIILGGR